MSWVGFAWLQLGWLSVSALACFRVHWFGLVWLCSVECSAPTPKVVGVRGCGSDDFGELWGVSSSPGREKSVDTGGASVFPPHCQPSLLALLCYNLLTVNISLPSTPVSQPPPVFPPSSFSYKTGPPLPPLVHRRRHRRRLVRLPRPNPELQGLHRYRHVS